MTIAEDARQRIATQLADSLPTWEDRQAVASASGLKDVQLTGRAKAAWRMMVDEAILQDRLSVVLDVASRRAPDDEALLRLAAAVREGRSVSRDFPWFAGGATALLVVIGASVLWIPFPGAGTAGDGAGSSQAIGSPPVEVSRQSVGSPVTGDAAEGVVEEPVAPPPRVGEPRAAERDALESSSAQPDREHPAGDDAPVQGAAEEGSQGVAAEDETREASRQEPVEEAPAPGSIKPAASVTPPPSVRGGAPCAGRRGYAYAGSDSPLRAGDSWEVSGAVNVRESYPRRDNQWDTRAALVCVLPAGARVTLVSDPVEVDGGAVWIEVSGEHTTGPAR